MYAQHSTICIVSIDSEAAKASMGMDYDPISDDELDELDELMGKNDGGEEDEQSSKPGKQFTSHQYMYVKVNSK